MYPPGQVGRDIELTIGRLLETRNSGNGGLLFDLDTPGRSRGAGGKHMKRVVVSLFIVLPLVGHSAVVWAEPATGESTPQQVAYGAGSVLGTLVYSPVKGAFCILGGVSSGFAFLVGGAEAAAKVAGATCRGTWVITPNVLKGQERVRFVGDTPRYPEEPPRHYAPWRGIEEGGHNKKTTQ
jgi:hypothetical protein